MSRVRVSLLGKFQVETESGKLCFPTRKAESLLACLILHPAGMRRDQLASLLWADVEDEFARRNLRTTLWRLKRTINDYSCMQIQSTEGNVILLKTGVEVDVIRFRELLQLGHGEVEKRLELLRSAESVYRGDLLEDRPEEWCEETRRLLRSEYMVLLKELTGISKTSGETALALKYARKAVEMEPLDEDANRELMVLFHLAGRRAEALAQFEILRQLLRRELDVSPSEATLQTWLHIRSHRNSERRFAPTAGSADVVASTKSDPIPLVGRADLISDLLHSIEDAAHGRGGAAIISGEAGIGKTKFVEFVLAETELRGFEILYGQCPDLQNPLPYQVFIQALWEKICPSPQVEKATPPSILLGALVSDALWRNSAYSTDVSSSAYDSAMIVEAFLSLLDKADIAQPTLLVLEDIHRIDRASINLLITLLGRLWKRKLFVLATIRSDEPEARAIVSQLITGGAREVRLRRLSEDDVGKLTRLALSASNVARPVLGYIWERSGGVPLFALEFTRYLQAEGMIARTPDGYWMLTGKMKAVEASGEVPSRVQEIVRRRIESLDPQVKRTLLTASVFSNEVHFEILRELVDLSEESFVDAVDRLVVLRLFRQTERGYEFGHDIIRLVAAASVGRAHLRVMHGRVGTLLEHRQPWRMQELAWHFEMAGDFARASSFAEASGDKARSVYANVDAAAWYTKALKHHEEIHSDYMHYVRVRTRLLQKRQEVLDLLGDRERQSADIAGIIANAREIGDKRLLAEALCLRANLLIRVNAAADALKCARLAGRYFKGVADVGGTARSHEIAGLAYENLRSYAKASAEFEEAQKMFRRAKDRAGEARGLFHIGVSLGYSNRNIAALGCLRRAERVFEAISDRRYLAMVFLQQGVLYRFLGKVGTAESLMIRAIEILREIGDRVGEARTLSQLALTHAAMGRLRHSVCDCETALRIARQMKDVRSLVMTLNNSADGVYRLTGAFSRARRYVHEALRLVSEAGNMENSAIYAETMALILLEMRRPQEALRWIKRSEARYVASGSRTWLGVEIYTRLGTILTELGRPKEALRALQRAQRHLGGNNDPVSDLLIATGVAKVFLQLGDIEAAARYQRRISNLLHHVDGIERMQDVFWTQFCVLKRLGKSAAASRALRRAVSVTMRQASTLKKPMRKRFLAIPLNVAILREFWDSNRFLRKQAASNLETEGLFDLLTESLSTGSSDVAWWAESPVAARRRAVLGMVHGGSVRQKELASRLGVSVRTVRNDITELKKQRLLEAHSAN